MRAASGGSTSTTCCCTTSYTASAGPCPRPSSYSEGTVTEGQECIIRAYLSRPAASSADARTRFQRSGLPLPYVYATPRVDGIADLEFWPRDHGMGRGC